MLKIKLLVIAFIIYYYQGLLSQNLISNSSFSVIKSKADTFSLIPHRVLPGAYTEVGNWFIPDYFKINNVKAALKEHCAQTTYYSFYDKDCFLARKCYKYFNNIMEGNLGFIQFHYKIGLLSSHLPIQQKFAEPLKKGKYCFKFKYKYIGYSSKRENSKIKLQFSFSNSNLNEYFNRDRLKLADKAITYSFKDSIYYKDHNSPWEQKCVIIDLSGGEKYLTIGFLQNNKKMMADWAVYLIDEIELYSLLETSSCGCDTTFSYLSDKFERDFELFKIIANDSLVVFSPKGNYLPDIITPEAKIILNQIILFLKRKPDLNIKWLVHEPVFSLNISPRFYHPYERYLRYYGIGKERISAENVMCKDTSELYCGRNYEYAKIDFIFTK